MVLPSREEIEYVVEHDVSKYQKSVVQVAYLSIECKESVRPVVNSPQHDQWPYKYKVEKSPGDVENEVVRSDIQVIQKQLQDKHHDGDKVACHIPKAEFWISENKIDDGHVNSRSSTYFE